jgi:cell division protein FtsQ
MWFRSEHKNQNRRLHRTHVLDVKLRSDQVHAARVRMVSWTFALVAGTFLGLYLVWRAGEWGLNTFVYENADYAIQQIDVATDGVIAPEQLRRWTGVKPGANLIALDLAAVKRNLELVSVVDTVSVERVLPHTLKVRVTERDPVAQVNVPHTDAAGAIVISVYQLDADGVVMQPLDPRLSVVPLARMNPSLPVIAGLNVFQLQPGRRVELPEVRAALQLIEAFDQSPMAGLVDLRRVDVTAPGVVIATTGQGSEITFALNNLDQQLRRWRGIYDLGVQKKATIASADLAVANNVPVRWMTASVVNDVLPKSAKPLKNRRKNV